jgi:hypothetical protein
VNNARLSEKYVHRVLSHCRVEHLFWKELFKVPLEEAIETVQAFEVITFADIWADMMGF